MKAVLEFEAPEACCECLMKYACGWSFRLVCKATGRAIDRYAHKGGRPLDCPLKIVMEAQDE